MALLELGLVRGLAVDLRVPEEGPASVRLPAEIEVADELRIADIAVVGHWRATRQKNDRVLQLVGGVADKAQRPPAAQVVLNRGGEIDAAVLLRRAVDIFVRDIADRERVGAIGAAVEQGTQRIRREAW